jgi:hypothetical protein
MTLTRESRFGVSALIIGNMASLGARTLLSLRHANRFLPSGFSAVSSVPSLPTILFLVASGLISYAHNVWKVQVMSPPDLFGWMKPRPL